MRINSKIKFDSLLSQLYESYNNNDINTFNVVLSKITYMDVFDDISLVLDNQCKLNVYSQTVITDDDLTVLDLTKSLLQCTLIGLLCDHYFYNEKEFTIRNVIFFLQSKINYKNDQPLGDVLYLWFTYINMIYDSHRDNKFLILYSKYYRDYLHVININLNEIIEYLLYILIK